MLLWSSPSYAKLLAKDLAWIRAVQVLTRKSPVTRKVLDQLVNSRPSKDVMTLLAWSAFILSCMRHGFPAFWSGLVNLAVSWILRWLLAAPRPYMFDAQLRPKTDRYRTSFGFPSLETHMATVVYGWMAWHSGEPWTYVFAAYLAIFTGFTRVYACSRFVHQVAASAVTGLAGLYISIAVENSVEVAMRHHRLGFAGTIVVVAGILGMWIESNDCTFAGIKKEEFTRVLRGILASTPENASSDNASEAEVDDISHHGIGSSARQERHRDRAKRDSFYFLQRIMEIRTAEAREIRAQAGYAKRRDFVVQRSK